MPGDAPRTRRVPRSSRAVGLARRPVRSESSEDRAGIDLGRPIGGDAATPGMDSLDRAGYAICSLGWPSRIGKRMAATTDHDACPQPHNPQTRVWRYMDFAKYVSILDSSCLYFARADRLGDPFEGSYPRGSIDLRPALYKLAPDADESRELEAASRLLRWFPQWVYLSCWHMSEHESAAMWQLYAKSNDAVAVASSYERLASCLPASVSIGAVTYIDYDFELFRMDHVLSPFMHKRKSYQHEREVRALVFDPPKEKGRLLDERENTQLGLPVAIKPSELIEDVYVAPTAPDWFRDLVRQVSRKYGQTFEIHRSSLDAAPIY
jgi:hypothetical protein